MARLVIHERKGPYLVEQDALKDGKTWICACGLTGSPPFCDNSHAATRKEAPDALVYYPDNDDENTPVDVDPDALSEGEQGGA